MSRSGRIALTLAIGFSALVPLTLGPLSAQVATNPFRTNYTWDKLKERKIGVPSGIRMDPDGKHIWILDRCGSNGCANSTLDPIMQLDLEGNLVKSFGKGLMGFPHGFAIDPQGNIYVTEGAPTGDNRGTEGLKKGLGHQVLKFSPDGKVLMRIGVAAVSGADETHMNGPSGVAIAANGDIWVTDGHGGPQGGPNKENMFGSRGGNNRLIRFSKDGKFLKAWGGGIGSESHDPMRFNDPHDIAIDPDGKIYVADRGNIRVQVIDKEGNFISQWTQFGKPSAIAIAGGHIYVADGMSDAHWNPGWERGIRIADLKTGWMKAFIPDDLVPKGAGTEFVGVDNKGNVYSGASSRQGLTVNELFRPF